MTWTYGGDPSASDTAKVRFLVGDTDSTDELLQDEEIAELLTDWSDTTLAAAAAADAIAAKLARKADFKNSKLAVQASQRAKAYLDLATRLRERSREETAPASFVGGLTVSGKTSLREDSDAVQPAFSVGMDDYPGSLAGDDDLEDG